MSPFWHLDIFRWLTDILGKRVNPLLFSKSQSKCCIYSDRSRLTPVTKKPPHGLEDHDLTNTIIHFIVLRLGSLKIVTFFFCLPSHLTLSGQPPNSQTPSRPIHPHPNLTRSCYVETSGEASNPCSIGYTQEEHFTCFLSLSLSFFLTPWKVVLKIEWNNAKRLSFLFSFLGGGGGGVRE